MPSKPTEAAVPSFEESLARLEQIVAALEEGRVGLAEALGQYEEGIKLLRQCYDLLEKAERRIELLSGIGPAGEAVTEAYDEGPESLEEKAQARSGRRTSKGTRRAASPVGDESSDMDEPGRLF